ncbi:MAG: conjugal transfer protein [Caulobacteraceae bacterium]|nr:conjugal transfer protein [Caulobacteraceae bacterium]
MRCGLFMRRAFSQNSAPHLLPRERNRVTLLRQSEKAMLSPKTQYNLANAKSYFEEHLCVGDYYSESQRVQGEWLGDGAAMLGLSGAVTQAQFLALCENLDAVTGERLTQRRKTTRQEGDGEVANRRVFYDFTLSPPKSVSVAALVGGDERIVAAHKAAVRLAAKELEQFAMTRVRVGRANEDRHTGNIVAALFEHDTSRALDPHLHTHCIVFNATHDATEDRWKALQSYGLLTAQKYVENVYYHALAQALRGFGYEVVNTARGDFEIAEISSAVRERFSKRHREIDERLRELLSTKSEARGKNIAAIRENIAHKERGKKAPALPLERLQEFWRNQLDQHERLDLVPPAAGAKPPLAADAEEAVSWAEEHLFERRSVVHEHEVWRHALAFGRGSPFTIGDVKAETARRAYIRTDAGKVSRQDVLAREWNIVELARDGTCRHSPFTAPDSWQRDDLAPDQQRAFTQILSSADFVTLFRGGAGTGKSYVLRRVQEALREAGRASVVLAPQRQQVLDLGRDGLANGQTVSEFLQRDTLARGSVVIVDEAGQIGGKQLLALLRLIQREGGRVILSGDTRQHGPVEASDALRAIERYAGLIPAELNAIHRQDPSLGKTDEEQSAIASYREAVQAAADGDLSLSFQTLDSIGAISECAADEQNAQLVETYLQHVSSGESALVVSQTRAEVREVNEAVRSRLRSNGTLVGPEQVLTALEPLDLTVAQKGDARFYPPGCLAILNRGKTAQQPGRIVAVTAVGVVVEVAGRLRTIRRCDLDRLGIYQPRPLALGQGDKLQLKANAISADGRKLANGEIVTVADLEASGVVRLEDGRALPAHFRQFTRGYAVTSYGSQGKTVDHVLFADSATRAATNAEQWYVTVSRGRKSVRIFTTDKAQLAANIRRVGQRELALDLGQPPQRAHRVRDHVLRGVRRGSEFARRVCMMISRRAWSPAAIVRQTVTPNL